MPPIIDILYRIGTEEFNKKELAQLRDEINVILTKEPESVNKKLPHVISVSSTSTQNITNEELREQEAKIKPLYVKLPKESSPRVERGHTLSIIKEHLQAHPGEFFTLKQLMEITGGSQPTVNRALRILDSDKTNKYSYMKGTSKSKYIVYNPEEPALLPTLLDAEEKKPKPVQVTAKTETDKVLEYLKKRAKGATIGRIAQHIHCADKYTSKLIVEMMQKGYISYVPTESGRTTMYGLSGRMQMKLNKDLCPTCMTNKPPAGEKFCKDCSGHYAGDENEN